MKMAPTIDTGCNTTNKGCRCAVPASDNLRTPRTTVMSLPPELLIMIFEYIDAPLREAYEEMRGVRPG